MATEIITKEVVTQESTDTVLLNLILGIFIAIVLGGIVWALAVGMFKTANTPYTDTINTMDTTIPTTNTIIPNTTYPTTNTNSVSPSSNDTSTTPIKPMSNNTPIR